MLRNIYQSKELQIKSKDFKHKSNQLESIDVRFKNRAFYTFTPPEVVE